MNTFKAFVEEQEEREIKELIVTFSNTPSKISPEFLTRVLNEIVEGKEKEWRKGYSYRLDRRPASQGGDQLHIFNRKGQAWAYRHTGNKSEPNKYTLQPTNIVKDIVSDIFSIERANIQEALIVKITDNSLFMEVIYQ